MEEQGSIETLYGKRRETFTKIANDRLYHAVKKGLSQGKRDSDINFNRAIAETRRLIDLNLDYYFVKNKPAYEHSGFGNLDIPISDLKSALENAGFKFIWQSNNQSEDNSYKAEQLIKFIDCLLDQVILRVVEEIKASINISSEN